MTNASDGVLSDKNDLIKEPRLQFLDVNQPFTHMAAYRLEELLSKTRILKAVKTNPAVFAQIHTAIAAWQPVRAEFINYSQDGSEFWVELNLVPVADEMGRYTHWISIEHDISERKRVEVALKQQTERERLLVVMAQRIRSSLNLEKILNTTVTEVRQFLQTERVFIYRFEPDWSGVVTVESVAVGWSPILGRKIKDSYFVEPDGRQLYKQGRIQATADIYTAGLSQCHIDLLTQLQVRANLVVPILQNQELWGLLVAQQCSEPRLWQQFEIDLLKQLATQVAIAIQQSELYQQLQVANQQLQLIASLDSLTSVANRRRFDECLSQEWRRLAREQAPLSLILCDIDFFKTYNDTYGHQVGDECLQQVAKAISDAVKRPADLVARYGGEEFAVILPHTTAAAVVQVAEKIRSGVHALNIVHASSQIRQHLTLSFGVATIVPDQEFSPSILVTAADKALYQAKAKGRDRVISVQLSQLMPC